jgi:hypothetical protein
VSLLDEAAADLASILGDTVGGFSIPITLTDPEGEETAVVGLATDIGLTIDPDTGQAVVGRKASIALSIRALEEAGLDQPRGIAGRTAKPWLATFTLATGAEQTFKISSAMPDKLGCLICFLEIYQPADS